MAKTRSPIYYLFPVIGLIGIFLVIGVAVMIATPVLTSVEEPTPEIDPSWMTELTDFLTGGGMQVSQSIITTGSDGKKILDLTIGEELEDGEKYKPYLLHWWVHADYYYILDWSDIDHHQVDSILTRVINSQGNFLYSVIVDVSVITQVIEKEISAEQYRESWEISEGAPEMEVIKLIE